MVRDGCSVHRALLALRIMRFQDEFPASQSPVGGNQRRCVRRRVSSTGRTRGTLPVLFWCLVAGRVCIRSVSKEAGESRETGRMCDHVSSLSFPAPYPTLCLSASTYFSRCGQPSATTTFSSVLDAICITAKFLWAWVHHEFLCQTPDKIRSTWLKAGMRAPGSGGRRTIAHIR